MSQTPSHVIDEQQPETATERIVRRRAITQTANRCTIIVQEAIEKGLTPNQIKKLVSDYEWFCRGYEDCLHSHDPTDSRNPVTTWENWNAGYE